MASVYRRKRSPYWWMAYRLPDGTRKNVSSGTEDRYEALRMALGLEGLGHRYSQDRAIALVNEIANAAGAGISKTLRVQEWMDSYIDLRSGGWSASSVRSYRAIANQFCKPYGNETLASLSINHLSGYRDLLLRQGRSAKTIRAHLVFIRQALEAAVGSGHLISNPAKAVHGPPVRQSVKQPFSLEQFQALLKATDGEWHLLILLAGLTGQRLRDCLSLSCDSIKPPYIHFTRQKNRDNHVVPMHSELQEALQEAAEGVLFPELSQYPLTGSRSVSARFREDILPRIGITQDYGTNMGGNKKVTRYSFHSLRHMLSTELNSAGVSPETKMLILGHTDVKVSAGYTHASMEDAAKAIDLVQISADKAP